MTEGEENGSDYFDAYREEAEKLLTIFESRLQFILLNLLKTLSSNKKRLVFRFNTFPLKLVIGASSRPFKFFLNFGNF